MKGDKKSKPATRQVTQSKHIERRLKGALGDAKGLRYEQRVSNYFAGKGWKPQIRFPKYGYNYDIYAQESDIFSGDKYLVVECKDKGRVSAKDVVRFINKVRTLYEHLCKNYFFEPQLFAYFCHSGDIDKDALELASNIKPKIEFLKL